MRRVYRRKRPFQYLLPFLIFVGIGVIGVLGFQLWNNLQGAKGDVYFYVASGKAKLLSYGLTEWDNAYSGTKMLLGDSVKTSTDGQGVLQFFNGTTVRLDNDTEVTITDITKRNDVEKIGLTLTHGNIWVNKVKSENVDESDFNVRTTHMEVSDVGTIFEVESNDTETVRVLKGAVNVQVLDSDNKGALLDTVQVGVGQEMTLDAAILQSFQNHQSPSVLMALSDAFKLSNWYSWNTNQDANPTDFSISHELSQENQSIEPTTMQSTQQSLLNSSQQIVSTPDQTPSAPTPDQTSTTLQAPVITQPSPAVMTTDQNKMTISGTVSPGTAKIVVHETYGGTSDDYTLSRFKAGDTSFSYNVSEALGNYKPGENDYSFSAYDASGNQSDSTDVQITYTKATAQITGALTAPQVVSYNGDSSSTASTVTVGVVKIIGSVQGAQSVYVNGYALSKFQPGDTSWTYYANEGAGNLNPGINQYQVYSVDPNGNKSSVTTFTITYNKPAGSSTSTSSGSSQQTTASGSTATGSTSSSTTGSTSSTSSQQSVPEGF